MNYHDYRPYDVINGDGLRSTLFLSGCIHGCKGCYNVETWDPSSGKLYTRDLEDRIISDLKGEDGVNRQGLTLTGGDPLHPNNLEEVFSLCARVSSECPDKDIWLWTGFTLEDIRDYSLDENNVARHMIIDLVDYLIDGKFEQDKHDPRLLYRGSSNQRVFKNLERII